MFGGPERKLLTLSLTKEPFSVVLSSLSVKSQDTNNLCPFLTEVVLQALDTAGVWRSILVTDFEVIMRGEQWYLHWLPIASTEWHLCSVFAALRP